MNFDRPKISIVALLGATLASLFFYPLFSELHDNIIYLQWRRINTIELFSACVLITLLAGIVLYFTFKCKNVHIKALIILTTVFLPLMSFSIYAGMQLLGKDPLIRISDFFSNTHRIILFSLAGIFVAGCAILLVRYARRIVQATTIALLILSPINLLSIWVGIKSYSKDALIIIDNSQDRQQYSGRFIPDSNTLIIVFDELSYEYIYENNKIKQRYENLKNLSSVCDNYHSALSPGDATLTAIPGLIMGKRFDEIKFKYGNIWEIAKGKELEILRIDDHNLFAYAKSVGYKTFCFGPYLNYCEMFGKWLDTGRSFSFYNYGNLSQDFKLYNPIFTNIAILPYKSPYGIVKNPIYSLWQKNVLEQSLALTVRAINSPDPFFIFVHFYIPHSPFTFDANGYYKNKRPFLQNSKNYSKQLDYLDVLLGKLITELKNNGKFDNSTIVVLSDHNNRAMFPEKKSSIPLLIKHKQQFTNKDIYNIVRAEEVLKKELLVY